MSAHKHTPGPWRTAGAQNNGAILVRGSEATSEVAIALQNDRRYSAEANARLIAAAPDSHEANVMFVKAMDRFCGIKPDWDDDCIYDELPSSELALAYFAARAAIAKATGEPA